MKEFKTLDEQIDLLKQRGLIINDEERAKKYLLSQNYYNIINGYAKYFPRDGDNYLANTTFDEITSLYVFERDFKQALLLAILEAETHMRAIFSYRFAEMFPNETYAYLNTSSYEQDKILLVTKTISDLSKTIQSNVRNQQGSSIAHYVNKYKHVPIWVLVNYLNLGELRYLLKNSKKALQNKVAKDLIGFVKESIPSTSEPLPPETINTFLENLNQIRNVCAHNNRIIDFRCHQNTKYWQPLHSMHGVCKDDSRRSAYEAYIILQCFISKNEYAMLHNTLRKRLRTLSNKLKTIPANYILEKLGFPEDWHTIVNKMEQI